jgi:hypothetical protein
VESGDLTGLAGRARRGLFSVQQAREDIVMTEVTRRTILTGAAAAALAAPAATQVHAAAPPAGKQAPSYYRYKVGDYEITAISDGARPVKLDTNPYRNVELKDVQGALEAAYMPKDQVSIFFNTTLVNTGSKLVLIDTGNGPRGGPATGHVAANLAAAGVDPKAIDSSSSRISMAIISAGCAAPITRSHSRMPRSRCRQRNGRIGRTTAI